MGMHDSWPLNCSPCIRAHAWYICIQCTHTQMVTVKKAASAEAHAELSSLQCITNRQLHICFISAGAGCAAHAAGASVAAVMHAHSGILGTLRCAAEAAGRSTDGARPRDNISPARSGGHAVRGRGSHDRPCLRPGQYLQRM
eukprot:366301-Chlamydomonas_euryale.AAC.6